MKKGKKDIIRINSKKKIIGFISVFLVLIVGIVSILLLNKKDDNLDNQDKKIATVIPKESPYTLDDIYEKVSNGYILKCHQTEENQDKCNEFATVLFNFYTYYNEDTKFLAASLVDKERYEIIQFDYFTYEEYQKVMEDDFFQTGKNDCLTGKKPGMCVPLARHFIQAFADFRK